MLVHTFLGARGGNGRHRPAAAAGLVATGAALALAVTAAPALAVQRPAEPLPLERLFDNTAVSDDARPGAADFDGAGNSLSAQDLAAAGWTPGRALGFDGARLRLPRAAPGAPDNVRADGQRVRLAGRGDAVSFLVAGTGGTAGGDGTVRYRDGSRGAYTLTAPDWRTGPLATKAVALPHLNSPAGQRAEKTRLFVVTVPVARGREIDSVVLPRTGAAAALHVFAVAVRAEPRGWTGSWAAASSGYTAVGPWRDRTLRLVVHTSAGGPRARIRLANTFAGRPLAIGHASVALQASGATAAGRPVPLRFGGRPGATVPAGAEQFSDPVGFRVPAGANLLVSVHLPGTVDALPVHGLALQRSYLSADDSGDRTGERAGGSYGQSLTTWPLLTGVDVGGGPGSVVALGDSITDGANSTPDANRRWPDLLWRRLAAQHAVPRLGVLNEAISGNRVVTDRYPGDGVSTITSGVSAQHRLDRDVLAQTSARTVLVFEGVNDVRAGTSADEVVTGLRAVTARAHARGLRVVMATIAPCAGERYCPPSANTQREKVNAFIRSGAGRFDAVLDFDAVLRDPARPERILPAYDSGDHLHPNDAGMRAFADAIELRDLVG
ncbi:SGNH/GDSL hydrolase family protein [Streptomyces varsoviensis]|uniref:SGNH/GDSL hydrolase family protein n=1 Tax=Streptomyces varsoviensis TaxID=67373 RepID=UPI000662ABEE|nr:SGNH/GDSL hydrolase family protein [Streptomyces varsoviensis]